MPAPERSRTTTWKEFIRSHLDVLAGADFFTVEVLTWRGLVTYYVLFFIEVCSRRVSFGGITRHPEIVLDAQVARNATMEDTGYLNGCRYLLHDRDQKFCRDFRETLAALEVRGTPKPLLEDVAVDSNTAGGQFDFSRNGTFVYLSGKSSTGTWRMAWLDRAGKVQPLLAPQGVYYEPRFSPDGKRLAFSSGTDIEIYDWGRETRTRLTFANQAVNNCPVWTPDGKHMVFMSEGASKFSLQWIRADGAGEVQLLLESKNRLSPYSFSPDGTRLAFSERNAETGSDLWTLPLDTSDPEHPKASKPERFLQTPSTGQNPTFSPDLRWVSYSSTESGRSEVFVRPFPAGGPSGSGKWLISTGGGTVSDLVPRRPGTVLRKSRQPHYGRCLHRDGGFLCCRETTPLVRSGSCWTLLDTGIWTWRRTARDL